jgi:hypothetical protein
MIDAEQAYLSTEIPAHAFPVVHPKPNHKLVISTEAAHVL